MAKCKHLGTNKECSLQPIQADCPYPDYPCNKIPTKKKDVVVKGWAHIHNDGKMEIFTMNVDRGYYSMPVAIHIKAADYARIRGNK